MAGTEKRKSSSVVAPEEAGQLAELIVQVAPAVCSVQALILAPATSETSFAPATSVVPLAAVASRILTESKVAGAALASAAVKVFEWAWARR